MPDTVREDTIPLSDAAALRCAANPAGRRSEAERGLQPRHPLGGRQAGQTQQVFGGAEQAQRDRECQYALAWTGGSIL